ncbi:MAG: hypothetical protein RIB98_11635 [Acidimicrobiales bacterium]
MNVSPEYVRRREEIAARAAGPGERPEDIAYTSVEDDVWATVSTALRAGWAEHAAAPVLAGIDTLGLDPRRVPQLTEVTERLEPVSGYRFEAVAGLVDTDVFFGHLAKGVFLSTQYVRWEGSPLYTPEPDVIHEVFGHAHVLTCPQIAGLHRRAGAAYSRLESAVARQFVADVFWFSAEFGVVRDRGEWRAYGAGLLSSIGELSQFATQATIRPLDVEAMGTLSYDIDHYQPVLFGAESLDEVQTVVGGFFDDCTDHSIQAHLSHSSHLGGPS